MAVECAIYFPTLETFPELISAIVAGKTYGVAKKAKIFGVKVMNKRGSGDKSDILAGLDVGIDVFC